MTATAKIEIEIDVKSTKAVDSMEKLNASTRKAKASTEDLSNGQGRLGASFDKATAAMERAGAPLDKINKLMGAGGLVAAAGGAMIAIDKLSQRSIALTDVNSNLRISIEAAKASAGGLVTNYDLATNAATAMRFGVVKTSAEFAKHVEIATKLARTTGQDSTKAVEDFTTALARQSPQILDNLGLQVDVEKANADYARTLGKTASALTETEKKQAFINAAYADAERKVGGLTVATDGWAISVQKAKVAAIDLGDVLLNLPQNVADLRKEIGHASEAAGIAADVWAMAARVGLGALTLGATEVIPLIGQISGSMSAGITQTQLWTQALERLGKVMGGDRAGEFSVGDLAKLVELQKVQGLVMSANARTIDALNYEKTAQMFANLDEEVRQEEAAKAKKAAARARKSQVNIKSLSLADSAIGVQRDGSDTREFESERALAAKDRVGSQFGNTEFDKDQAAEAEKKRIAAIEDAKKAAEDAAKERHAAEMQRLKEQQDRYEQTGAAIGNTVAGLATTWLQAGDLSARGFAKAIQAWGKAESIKMAGIAISEGVQALVSLATFNFPGAAAHAAAAAAAGAAAVAIAGLVGATGGFGPVGTKNVKGFGGDAFGSGTAFGDSAANDGPSVTNSQSDTVPVSPQEAAQHAGVGKKTSGGTTNYYFNAIGSIDEVAARRIAQGMQRAGKTGGRLTGS
jgi:hypothetical protein